MDNQSEPKMTLFRACSIIERFCDFEPTEQDIIDAWSYLISSGNAFKLQGSYGRNAADLIMWGTFSPSGVYLG